jgi:tetratricopeptide (TPR) repeat protein
MDSNTSGPLKPRLLALVAQGEADEQAFHAQLTPAQRAAAGTPAALSAKDYVVHLTAWKAQAVRLMNAAAVGETPEPLPDTDSFNAQVFAAGQERPWAEVQAEADRAGAALRGAVEACSEADLAATDRIPGRPGQPLWGRVLIAGYQHGTMHVADFYRAAGDLARAEAAHQAAVATTARLFGESEQQGFALYNLAGFYAQTGRPGPALDALRRAVALNPAFRGFAGRDPALAALHADPAFQALIAP